MLRFTLWSRQRLANDTIICYAVPGFAVGTAVTTVSLLLHLSVRDPVALIYLAAIAVRFWYGQRGPGILAFSVSTICLVIYFLALERSWIQVVRYDLPTICLYVVLACWIYLFMESRHRLEQVLRRNGEELEAAVKARTSEVVQINAEYIRLFSTQLLSELLC